jgi:integrase
MRKKLTSKIIEHLKVPGPKRVDVWDTVLQGFGTRVSPTGRKVWFVVARTDGRLRRVTIGTYPAISLAEAREEARKIISKAQLGVLDEPARGAKQSLGELAPLFIQLYARPKNRDWKETERVLGKFAALFSKDINAIRRPDVVRVLDGIIAHGTPYRANRALAALKKLMSWALDRGIIEINPIAGLKPPHKEQARDRVLSDPELARLLNVTDAEGYPFGDMFKMLVMTGQRRGEVTGMRWSEIDWERRTWTIPSFRSKNQQSHEVPLPEPVLQLLRSLPRFLSSEYVFTTTGKTSISGFSRAKRRVYVAVATTDWRTHDLRRTAASGMARLGVPPHVVEKVLNHKSGIISGVAAVYNRYGYEKEKRDALETWADYVEALRHTVTLSSNGAGQTTNAHGMVSGGPRPLA